MNIPIRPSPSIDTTRPSARSGPRVSRGRVCPDEILGVVGHNGDPVVGHPGAMSVVPLKIGNVRWSVDELEPLDDAK